MSLMFADSRDHALAALVIREAHQAASKKPGGFVGRTAVQKLMYFIRALGVPMKYRFRLHHYGPYSEDLGDDVEYLLADDVIEDSSINQRKFSSFRLGPEGEGLIQKYQSSFRDHLKAIQSVVQAFGGWEPDRLELLMTLHYLHREERAKDPDKNISEIVIERFMSVKGGKERKTVKFTRANVSKWYDTMKELGLLK